MLIDFFKKPTTKNIGNFFEKKAIEYIKENGYKVVERNYKTKFGEIDVIAFDKKSNCLVFLEVRFRSNLSFGLPEETITSKKQKRIILSALYYLKLNKKNYNSYRFDVISFTSDNDIQHIKDAFRIDAHPELIHKNF